MLSPGFGTSARDAEGMRHFANFMDYGVGYPAVAGLSIFALPALAPASGLPLLVAAQNALNSSLPLISATALKVIVHATQHGPEAQQLANEVLEKSPAEIQAEMQISMAANRALTAAAVEPGR